MPEKLFVTLEHFLKFHQTAVSLIQFTVKTVSPGVRFGTVLTDGRKIDAAGKIGNIL